MAGSIRGSQCFSLSVGVFFCFSWVFGWSGLFGGCCCCLFFPFEIGEEKIKLLWLILLQIRVRGAISLQQYDAKSMDQWLLLQALHHNDRPVLFLPGRGDPATWHCLRWLAQTGCSAGWAVVLASVNFECHQHWHFLGFFPAAIPLQPW